MVDWNIKKNLRYLIPTLIVFLLIPHLVMSMPDLETFPLARWRDEYTDRTPLVIYYLVVWLLVPALGAAISLRRVMKGEQFSFLPAIVAELCILTYSLRVDAGEARGPVLALLLAPLLMLLVECFSFVGRYSGSGYLRAGMAKNCGFLAMVFYCSSILPLCFLISAIYSYVFLGGTATWSDLFFLGPLVPVLMFLPAYQVAKNEPLTTGGMIGILILYVSSVLINVTYYSWIANLICVTAGFVLLFLAEGFIALVRWTVERISAKRGGAPG